jgi:hypothetical protein
MNRVVHAQLLGITLRRASRKAESGIDLEEVADHQTRAVESEKPRCSGAAGSVRQSTSDTNSEDQAVHVREDEVDHLNPAVIAKCQQAEWMAPQVKAVARHHLDGCGAHKERASDDSCAQQCSGRHRSSCLRL